MSVRAVSLPTAGKLVELEGLRGWLAWWVVVGHSLEEAGWSASYLPTLGKGLLAPALGVKLFIILSGFVITLLLDKQNQSYREFIGTRAFRLFPLYYAMLLVGVGTLPWLRSFYPAYLAHIGNPPELRALYDTWRLQALHLPAYLAVCLTGLHGCIPFRWLPNAQSAFVSQAWSISLEWQFYLVAPLIWWSLQRRWGMVALAFLFCATLGSREHFSVGNWSSFLPQNAEFFALGAISFFAYKHFRLDHPRYGAYARVLFATILLAVGFVPFLYASVLIPWPWYPVATLALPVGLWMIALALAIARRHEPNHPFTRLVSYPLVHPWAVRLGRISYSTYLCHYTVIYLLQWSMLRLAVGHISKWTMIAVFLTAGAPLTLTFSHVLYRWVEVPGMALGKRWFGRRPSLPSPSVIPVAAADAVSAPALSR